MTGKTIKQTVAGIVVLAFFGTWLAMEWQGREADSVILLAAVAIIMGAAYYLWDDAMDSGVEAVQEMQGEDEDD